MPEYQLWLAMKQRCHNPKNKRYQYYGGRGIQVCQKWRNSFKAFLADVGRRPVPGLELDRRDNNKGYEPGNVRWTTPLVQRRNRRNVQQYEHQGRKMYLVEWAKEINVTLATLEKRVRIYGWSIERALTTPVGAPKRTSRMLTLNGKTQPMVQWAKELGINYRVLKSRLHRGDSMEKALRP